MDRIQPRKTRLTEPYWEGCRSGELRLQRCTACGNCQFYPRIACSHCGATDLAWQRASGRGHIASFTVVRRGITQAYEAPYVVALIDLEEGPRMMSTITGCDPESVRIGQPVSVAFEEWSEEVSLPVFIPSENGETP
jgi:uncharacterized OB-fold protein